MAVHLGHKSVGSLLPRLGQGGQRVSSVLSVWCGIGRGSSNAAEARLAGPGLHGRGTSDPDSRCWHRSMCRSLPPRSLRCPSGRPPPWSKQPPQGKHRSRCAPSPWTSQAQSAPRRSPGSAHLLYLPSPQPITLRSGQGMAGPMAIYRREPVIAWGQAISLAGHGAPIYAAAPPPQMDIISW
ncbi:hypothetical protein NDU88_002963 [Pleurodeles waltl]|uniref:Uncharacterized protein n=1 Tax=Pleurodeles waltl TaxID=8319 RepID=A0AAV7RCJ8_PLEWA|nr:hypothetical protein NDU88_002963 [Pleurodeles waltl]